MVSKTREKLIEVARQLFAHKGVENTTMNDIASASEKGRRTIYTYFKSKRDIYNAVVKNESELIVERLSVIPAQDVSPEEKLMNFIFVRFEAIKELVTRNGSLRAGFFRDVRKVERARRGTLSQECSVLMSILKEGVEKGAFSIKHIDKTARVMLLCLQGLDVPYVRDSFAEMDIEKNKLREYIQDFILYGITAKNASQPAAKSDDSNPI
ncbi:MAG: TetR family transcriptional regulator [bacterium]|nr:TetR family transcriptional regulator [bacterium]